MMFKNRIRSSMGERVYSFFIYFIVILLCVSIIVPFVNILALAFNSGADAQRGGIYLWPRIWSLDNFKEIFSQSYILRGLYVTLFRTIIGTVLSVFLTAMAAYALKHHSLPGRKGLTFFVFFTMLFSGGIIPYYMVLKELHLTNTIWVFILPTLYSVWNIIIMRTFFAEIPPSVEESARIDGAGDLRIFLKIILPMSKPVVIAISLFNAVSHWNDWFAGAFFVRDRALKPLSTILQEMLTQQNALKQLLMQSSSADYSILEQMTVTGDSMKMATIITVITPIIIVYPFLQKHFAKGVSIGSVKG